MPARIKDFWSAVDIRSAGECWPWKRGKGGGYGIYRGKKAHTTAFRLHNKRDIPRGMVVRHTCDNPPCCNPDHLELGTHADNMRDIVRRGRHWAQKNPQAAADWGRKHGKHEMPRGDVNPNAKLTTGAVLEIRRSSETNRRLAERFSVDVGTIARVRHRQIWNHI